MTRYANRPTFCTGATMWKNGRRWLRQCTNPPMVDRTQCADCRRLETEQLSKEMDRRIPAQAPISRRKRHEVNDG